MRCSLFAYCPTTSVAFARFKRIIHTVTARTTFPPAPKGRCVFDEKLLYHEPIFHSHGFPITEHSTTIKEMGLFILKLLRCKMVTAVVSSWDPTADKKRFNRLLKVAETGALQTDFCSPSNNVTRNNEFWAQQTMTATDQQVLSC